MIFNQFRHMKNSPLPESGYFKNLPPFYETGSKFYPPPPPYPQDAMCLRLQNCVQHAFMPRADKPKSSTRSFVIVQYGSTQQGKRICRISDCRDKINGRKVCKKLIARLEPRTREERSWKQCCNDCNVPSYLLLFKEAFHIYSSFFETYKDEEAFVWGFCYY